MNISNKLYNLRVDRGLTQADMGKIAGVSDKTISAWEAGSRCPKVVPYIQNICDHFRLDMLAFIDEKNDGFGEKENQPTETDGLDNLDREIIGRLAQLTSEELAKVDAFVQGLLASR